MLRLKGWPDCPEPAAERLGARLAIEAPPLPCQARSARRDSRSRAIVASSPRQAGGKVECLQSADEERRMSRSYHIQFVIKPGVLTGRQNSDDSRRPRKGEGIGCLENCESPFLQTALQVVCYSLVLFGSG